MLRASRFGWKKTLEKQHYYYESLDSGNPDIDIAPPFTAPETFQMQR